MIESPRNSIFLAGSGGGGARVAVNSPSPSGGEGSSEFYRAAVCAAVARSDRPSQRRERRGSGRTSGGDNRQAREGHVIRNRRAAVPVGFGGLEHPDGVGARGQLAERVRVCRRQTARPLSIQTARRQHCRESVCVCVICVCGVRVCVLVWSVGWVGLGLGVGGGGWGGRAGAHRRPRSGSSW